MGVGAALAAVEHDMDQNLALRLAVVTGRVDDETAEAIYEYETDVELFQSGQEAAEHGLRDVEAPDDRALSSITKIETKRARLQ